MQVVTVLPPKLFTPHIKKAFYIALDLLMQYRPDQGVLEAGLKQQGRAVNAIGSQNNKIGASFVFLTVVEEANSLRDAILNVDVFHLRVDADVKIGVIDNVLHAIKRGKLGFDRAPPALIRSATGVP